MVELATHFFVLIIYFVLLPHDFLTLFFNERFYIISHSRIAKAEH